MPSEAGRAQYSPLKYSCFVLAVRRAYRRKRCQTACKPGSVRRRIAAPTRRPFLWDAPCGAPRATNPGGGSEHPGRGSSPRPAAPIRSCSRWGLPCRRRCRRRGALLPHRFTLAGRWTGHGPAVCSLWHFPWGRPRRPLAGTVVPWSPDFPPAGRLSPPASDRPAVWRPAGAQSRRQGQAIRSRVRRAASGVRPGRPAIWPRRRRGRRQPLDDACAASRATASSRASVPASA